MTDDLFAFLLDASKQHFQNFLSNVWGTVGALMVGIGWILTSEQARIFLGKNPMERWLCTLVVVAFWVVHIVVIVWHKRKMSQVIALIREGELTNVEEKYYDFYRLPYSWFWIIAGMNSLLFSALLFLIFRSA